MRVHLYVGRDLPPADEGGVSDPFIIVRCAGNIIQSKVKQQTLNPGWYETLTMDVTLPEFEKDVEIIYSFFDFFFGIFKFLSF